MRYPQTIMHLLKPSKNLSLRIIALLAVVMLPFVSAHAKWGDKVLNRPYADMKRIHLGFSVGAHFQDLNFTHNGYVTPEGEQWHADVPSISPGFCVNVLGDLRLHKHFNLRLTPGMYFGSKGVTMLDPKSGATRLQDVKCAYVVVPLDLKISGERYWQTRPYVTLGAMASFDVSKKRTEVLMFKPFDFYLTVGLGTDFYLPFFKFIPEIKFCFGLTDILKHSRPDLVDNPEDFKITQSIAKAKSGMVVVSFYFE